MNFRYESIAIQDMDIFGMTLLRFNSQHSIQLPLNVKLMKHEQ